MDVQIQFLLSNIQSLRKLRYLEVSNTNMVELPDSVTSLSNLQTLDLTNCELKVIPDSISGLKNLRFLNLSDNPFEKLPASVVTLSNLETLALQPPTGLRELTIQNFSGAVFPRWMCVPSDLPNLVKLDLDNCTEIDTLPDIGGLASLTELSLNNIHLLEELCYSCACLQDLRISDCKSLKEIPSFPCLMMLVLKKVDHKLVCSVGRSQTSLTQLWLENIEDLEYFPVTNFNLQIQSIKGCNQFKGFGVNEDGLLFDNTILGSKSYSSSLQQLVLTTDCSVLKFLPDIRGSTSLRALTIFNCPQVKESLTYDLKSLSFLKVLKVDFIERDEKRGDPSTVEDLINLMNK